MKIRTTSCVQELRASQQIAYPLKPSAAVLALRGNGPFQSHHLQPHGANDHHLRGDAANRPNHRRRPSAALTVPRRRAESRAGPDPLSGLLRHKYTLHREIELGASVSHPHVPEVVRRCSLPPPPAGPDSTVRSVSSQLVRFVCLLQPASMPGLPGVASSDDPTSQSPAQLARESRVNFLC